MRLHSVPSLIAVAALMMLGGCATRPINPPIEQVDLAKGYRFDTRREHRRNYDADNLVILAFSGGGTRAAAFSYGVLEALRRMEAVSSKGTKVRMLDEVGPRRRRVGWQLHRAGLRPLRRQAVRHLRDQLPETRRPGRVDPARPESRQLGRPFVRQLGPFRTGGAVLRRNSLPRRDLRRPRSRRRPPDSRERHRHLDRRALGLPAIATSTTSART